MGEKAGHPFRGNQFTSSKGGGAGKAQGRGTPERLARAKQLRTVHGASTEVLKAALDSNSGDSSFRYDLSRELHKRSKRTPVIDHKYIAEQAVKAVQGGAKPEHVQVMVDTLKQQMHQKKVEQMQRWENRRDVKKAANAIAQREKRQQERKDVLREGGRVTIVGQVHGEGKGGFISEVSPSGSFFGVQGHKSGKFLGYFHESNLKPKASGGGGGRRVPKHVKERFRGVFNPERKK
jgi:hypothetical protein